MNILTGINTSIINSPKGVTAIAVKTNTTNSKQLIYLPLDQLQEVMFAVFGCYRTLHRHYQQSPEQIRNRVNTHAQVLSTNIPEFSLDEMQNPNSGRCVTGFELKQRQEQIHFLFLLQNEENLVLVLAYTQIEYVLSLMVKTLQRAGNEPLLGLCLSMNDFVPFYVTDFSHLESQGINYHQFSVPDWKSALFDTFHSILFILPAGAIPCGAIIKSTPELATGRLEFISQLLLQNNSLLAAHQHPGMAIEHSKLDIPAGEESMARLLRAHAAHRTMKM